MKRVEQCLPAKVPMNVDGGNSLNQVKGEKVWPIIFVCALLMVFENTNRKLKTIP